MRCSKKLREALATGYFGMSTTLYLVYGVPLKLSVGDFRRYELARVLSLILQLHALTNCSRNTKTPLPAGFLTHIFSKL
jgi:hypothetical protein